MISQNKYGMKINLEFAITVSMLLLVLSWNWYSKNYEMIQYIIKEIYYWFPICFKILILVLAVLYNVKIYLKDVLRNVCNASKI